MLRGNAHVYLKNRYTPLSYKLYKEQWKEIKMLSGKNKARLPILITLSTLGMGLEIFYFYKKVFK
jgi:hypothetical protein